MFSLLWNGRLMLYRAGHDENIVSCNSLNARNKLLKQEKACANKIVPDQTAQGSSLIWNYLFDISSRYMLISVGYVPVHILVIEIDI